jgi:hypothetical protein
VAVLPWCLGLNLLGYVLLCLATGAGGRIALPLFWPAVLWGTLAYAALFHLMGAWFRRSAVVAIVYAFFVETFVGTFPGSMKRVSLCFYTRCQVLEVIDSFGMKPFVDPGIYLPVSGTTALFVLGVITVVLLALGAILFSRLEFREES